MAQDVSATLHYDPMAPAFAVDPYPTLRRFRERAPLFYWEAGRGWIAFRYDDVMALIRDPRLTTDYTLGAGISPEIRQAFPDYARLRQHDLQLVSDDVHRKIRKLVGPYFGPRALAGHAAAIEAQIAALLEALPREGVFNAVEFTRRYPVRVISSLLGIPAGHEDTFFRFAEALIATIDPSLKPEVFASFMPAISRGVGVVSQLIEARRRGEPQDDLLSKLIHACEEEERLTDDELFSLVGGIIVGGSDTTVSLTSYAIHNLLRHPDQLARFRAAPKELARGVIDETLRYDSFGRSGLVRFATETIEYKGVTIHRGQPVFLSFMSALRDPDYVADPDTYDIGRTFNTSPWFGWGAHFCLGAPLVRIEAAAALRLFFARYPKIELAGDPTYGFHPIFRDMTELPVRVG